MRAIDRILPLGMHDAPPRLAAVPDGARSIATAREAAAVSALADGDVDALGELYDLHHAPVRAFARRLLGDDASAEDLVHDVFLEVWERAGDYDPARGSVRSWILVRARSRCLDRRKSPAVSRRREMPPDPPQEGVPERIERLVDSTRLEGVLSRLPPEQREALLLGYCDGLSSTEIAARTAVPVGTVKSRVHAAMQRLRAELAADAPA